ncbi:MAG: Lrp/AsnC ligand binding domain-containing protein [Candidatus Korarchaeota archaeon]|nr:Lrp/AsnC ligand binding domain-containing protein [Candidatus Korarchaeota archaeon]MDK2384097.1 Lrp/AsnC ligand binding domain-containing protein [Candidatus Korarchaeota archaeon]
MTLVIVSIRVESKLLDKVTEALKEYPEVVDLYEVTGEFDVVAVVEAENTVEFRKFLKDKLLKVEGVEATHSVVVLYTHKRGGKVL